jgi:endonuclease YncB( thermonuclease family)
MDPVYRYSATLHRIVDADTYELSIDLGFKVFVTIPVRLYGWNCPEHNAPGGPEATAAATAILTGQPLIIESYKSRQTFARWLATIWIGEDNLGALLQAGGHAVPYRVT